MLYGVKFLFPSFLLQVLFSIILPHLWFFPRELFSHHCKTISGKDSGRSWKSDCLWFSPLSPRMDPLILTLCWVSEILSFYPEALWFQRKRNQSLCWRTWKEGSVVSFTKPQIKALGKWEHFNMLGAASPALHRSVCTIMPSKLLPEREMPPFKGPLHWWPKGHVMKF